MRTFADTISPWETHLGQSTTSCPSTDRRDSCLPPVVRVAHRLLSSSGRAGGAYTRLDHPCCHFKNVGTHECLASLLLNVARLGKPHATDCLENRRGSPRVILRRTLDDSRSCALVVERRLFWSFFICVFSCFLRGSVCLSRLVRRAARRSRIFHASNACFVFTGASRALHRHLHSTVVLVVSNCAFTLVVSPAAQ